MKPTITLEFPLLDREELALLQQSILDALQLLNKVDPTEEEAVYLKHSTYWLLRLLQRIVEYQATKS